MFIIRVCEDDDRSDDEFVNGYQNDDLSYNFESARKRLIKTLTR
jgi:hypothetical protein